MTTPMIVTNSDDYQEIRILKTGNVTKQDAVLEIKDHECINKGFTDEIRKIEETHWAEMVSKPYRLTHHLMPHAAG